MKFKYSAIYQCRGIEPAGVKLVVGGILLEIFDGPRSLSVIYESVVVVAIGESEPADIIRTLDISQGRYIQFTVKADTCGYASEEECGKKIDQAILNVRLATDTFMFRNLIYKGWIADQFSAMEFSRVYSVVAEYHRFDKTLQTQWQRLTNSQNRDSSLQEKIHRMARYYIKALARRNDEEKFLYLWIVLEIWPMTNTSDIRPISDMLSRIVGMPALDIKKKLGIPQLCKARGDLIHDGYLPIRQEAQRDMFARLEEICLVFLKDLSGIEYNGSLDNYLK